MLLKETRNHILRCLLNNVILLLKGWGILDTIRGVLVLLEKLSEDVEVAILTLLLLLLPIHQGMLLLLLVLKSSTYSQG